MEHLWSPWRMQYLRGQDQTAAAPTGGTAPLGSTGCIFCDKPRDDHDLQNLIVHRGERAFAMLNLYPYNNGHLMVVPYAHVPSLEGLDAPTLTELMLITNEAFRALRSVYKPQAFNFGANIGTAAGAGIADHVHLHVVPRWAGDTNYMTAVAGTRVIPEELHDTYHLLRDAWPK